MAGGVQSFLKTAYTCAAKLREDGDPRIETQMTACQAAINKALSTYGKKKVKAKASLKKLDDALDQVKKCLDAVPAPDTKGALAAIQQARTAAVATETVAVKTG